MIFMISRGVFLAVYLKASHLLTDRIIQGFQMFRGFGMYGNDLTAVFQNRLTIAVFKVSDPVIADTGSDQTFAVLMTAE